MGVIKPPWIPEEWFNQTPFNYCDHFGDKELLAKVCKICREELETLAEYRKRGEDPYAWENVIKEVAQNLAKTMAMVTEKARELGIDLDNLPAEEKEEGPPPETYPIYNSVCEYGNRISEAIEALRYLPVEANGRMVSLAIEIFGHSRFYAQAKIARALSSRWEEINDPEDDFLDSKTSAFLAYVAIKRNTKALKTLTSHKPLKYLKINHKILAKESLELTEMIRREFFPEDKLVYHEYGFDYPY